MSEKQISGAVIDLVEAKRLINGFRTHYPNQIAAHVIDAALLKQIIDQQGCAEVRIYNGYDPIENKISPVIVGVDDNDADMTGVLLDKTRPCPPFRNMLGLLDTTI